MRRSAKPLGFEGEKSGYRYCIDRVSEKNALCMVCIEGLLHKSSETSMSLTKVNSLVLGSAPDDSARRRDSDER